MPTLTLTEAGDGKASFALDLGAEVVRLVNPDGNVVAMFNRSDATAKILLPSKNPPRDAICIRVERDQLVQLTSTDSALRALRSYLNAGPTDFTTPTDDTNPPPTTQTRSVTRDVIIGTVVLLVGTALALVGVLEASRGLLGWTLLVIGLLIALIGVGWIVEAKRRPPSA